MKNMTNIVSKVLLIAGITLISACNTMPTSSSSSSSGSPPPSGSPPSSSGTSSSSSSGSSSSSQSGSQSSSSGQGAGQQDSSSQAGAAGKGEQQGDAQAGAGTENGGGEKSDDEILADALGEFSKGRNKAQQEGAEQGEANRSTNTSTGEGQGVLTEEERSGKLDEQLNDKFAKFDDLMLGERESIAKSDNEGGSGTYGLDDGEGDGEGDNPLQTAMVNENSGSRRAAMKGDIPTDDLPPPPGDVGEGQDDDIIARQLREAAQKERDPELRAKLWDEYRKYKKGA
jgi:hypothetical protein